MSQDGFTLYSTAYISYEEYMGWLYQLNAVLIPEEGGAFDARISKDIHHVWTYLFREDDLDRDMEEMAEVPGVLVKIRQVLGGEPKSAVALATNKVVGSKILAVEFAALCADHYPCVVLQTVGDVIYSRQELLKYRDAGMGFDGFTWETANSPHPLSWNIPWIREKPGNSSKDEIFVQSDRSEERSKGQLGA